MNNNTDNKATSELNYEVHSEISQTFMIELSLRNSQQLKSANHFYKKVLPRLLNGVQSKKNR